MFKSVREADPDEEREEYISQVELRACKIIYPGASRENTPPFAMR